MKEINVEEATSGAPTASKYGRYGFKDKAKPSPAPHPKFKGTWDGLKVFIFDCTDGKQYDMYNVAMKEMAECIGREYTYGGDIRWGVERELMFTVYMPGEPATDANATANHIWERRIDEYIGMTS
jgi:hypothetical protein